MTSIVFNSIPSLVTETDAASSKFRPSAGKQTSDTMVEVYTLRSYSHPSKQASSGTLDRLTSTPGNKPLSEKLSIASSLYLEHLLGSRAPPWMSFSRGMLLFLHASLRLTCAGTRQRWGGVSARNTMERPVKPLGMMLRLRRKKTCFWKCPHSPRKAVAAS